MQTFSQYIKQNTYHTHTYSKYVIVPFTTAKLQSTVRCMAI
uniref:Uncharacterized protein n=1 Tax=Arundo donax TaxID=35708 RepID=A0A0A8XU84_ARUDO